MGWRGYIDDTRKTVFFWSQKAACTTLFAILADNMTPRPARKGVFHRDSFAYPRCLITIRDHGYRSAIVVRDPVARVISAYLNKFCLYDGKPLRHRSDLEVFAQALLDEHRAFHGLTSEANTITFRQFLDSIGRMSANRPSPRKPINGHWETQMPPFLVAEGFRHDHVIRVENFEADMKALADLVGLSFVPRVMNRTDRAPRDACGFLGDTPACDLAGQALDNRSFLDDGIRAQIARLYAVDFDTFGYDLRVWD